MEYTVDEMWETLETSIIPAMINCPIDLLVISMKADKA